MIDLDLILAIAHHFAVFAVFGLRSGLSVAVGQLTGYRLRP